MSKKKPSPERLATLNGIAITQMRTHDFTLPISLFTLQSLVQDRLFESDFDQMIKNLPEKGDEAHAEARRTRRKDL